jgi:branched-chain amino acid transport system ATP-binding protein
MPDPAWLSLYSLNVYYEKVAALKNVSLAVESGTVVTLIGANGAGKSTTLRAISGLIPITNGEILFEGRTINGLAPQRIVRAGIAHVPEGRRLFPFMTVMENLMTGAYCRRDKKEIQGNLSTVYEHFPILKERQFQRGGSLSGGQQQMLAIGRALMSNPKLLLLDEPSMGLAPLMVKEVGRIIGDINRKGVGIIVVEQNAHMALRLAHQAYVLETGSITIQGKGSDLIQNEHVKKAYLGG